MNTIHVIFAVVLTIIPSAHALVVTNAKDGITLTVESSIGANQKLHIACALVNNSPYTFPYPVVSSSSAFQFKLHDNEGNVVPQIERWADGHAQEGSAHFKNPTGFIADYVRPGEKRCYEFDLEKAYGTLEHNDETLEVEWRSFWGAEEIEVPLDVPVGSKTPRHRMEQNHFLGNWTVSVSLPLTEMAEDKKASPHSDGSSAIPPSETTSRETPISKTPPPAAPPLKNSPNPQNSWWWSLLVIPVLLVVWLVLRLRK
jgi:hypothetical protein